MSEIRSCLRSRQRGQTIVEHIILWPVLVFTTLITLQLALLYRDKALLNDAVFRATREGTLNHAFIEPMEDKFEEALIPLFVKRDGVAGYWDAERRAKGQLPLLTPRVGIVDKIYTQPRIDIISPNREMFREFSMNMYEVPDGCDDYDIRLERNNRNDVSRCNTNPSGPDDWREVQYRQIPNDNLLVRPDATDSFLVEGQTVEVNLRDANLLKTRGHWCAPLEVPFGRFAVYYFARAWDELYELAGGGEHTHWNVCRNKTLTNRIQNAAIGTPRVFFIPISSGSVMRMQSTVRCEGDERRGRADRCTNLRD